MTSRRLDANQTFLPLAVFLFTAVVSAQFSRANVFNNVSEVTTEGYQLLYDLSLPNGAAFNSAAITYSVDNSGSLARPFDRVAYYLELDDGGGSKYAYVSMDPFTYDPAKIGVPARNTINGSLSSASDRYQQVVSNANVFSNHAGVTSGTGLSTVNMEFWSTNYGKENTSGNGINIPNASNATYDAGDNPRTDDTHYGSMQFHNHAAGDSHTIFAYNRWGANSTGNSDLGIGSRGSGDPDWTFAGNANTYTAKRLQVLVRTYEPNVFADVPEAQDYKLVYALDLPNSATDMHNTGVPYQWENPESVSGYLDRVAYYVELKTPTGEREWVYASMDAFTQDASLLGVPTLSSGAAFQQNVTNLNVLSNTTKVVTGAGLTTGNIEIWPNNYGAANEAGVPGASGSVYDTGDDLNEGVPAGYGSLQIHNHAAGANETVLAYNAWGSSSRIGDVGIGNQPSDHPDWTFANNAGNYEIARLYVLAKEGAPPPVQIGNLSGPVVYQRDTTNHAEVVLQGTYNGTPTAIQARAVPRSGFGGTATEWVTIDAAPSGGTFDSQLRVGGGWYDVEVRAMDGGAVLGSSTAEQVGIGEVFITAGQSNSANSGEVAQSPDDPRVFAFNGTSWSPANDPQPIATGSNGSPWPELGDLLAEQHDVPIGFVSVGWGGTSVAQWVPGASGPDSEPLYNRLQNAIDELGPDGFRAVLWHQGETDAGNGTSEADYAQRLQSVIDQSRIDAGADVTWGVALVSYRDQYLTNDPDVVAGQLDVINGDANVFQGANTDTLIGFPYRNNGGAGIHFSTAGLEEHARLWRVAIEEAGLIVVPEPATLGLLWLGVSSLLVVRRRHRR
jgi:hypothetical protein